MRFLPLVVVCAFAAIANAQDQGEDEKLTSRLLRPNMEMANKSFDKTYREAGKQSSEKKAAGMREFSFQDKVRSKAFSTRAFNTNSHWAGDFKFDTREASTSTRTAIKNAEKDYETGRVEMEIAREAQKRYDSQEYSTGEAIVKGTAQGSINKQYGVNEPMTIDQVRDMLNKNE